MFENNNISHRAFIQYWLIQSDTTCPAGFAIPFGGRYLLCDISNSSGAVPTTAVPADEPRSGHADRNRQRRSDSITMTIGGTAFARAGDNAVNAAAGWTIAEFNVFGDGGNAVGVGSQLSSILVPRSSRIRINYGGTVLRSAWRKALRPEPTTSALGQPRLLHRSRGPPSFSQKARRRHPVKLCGLHRLGDTHLTTLSGLLYDFQASGDFELLQTSSGFTVQNRQVSGAPTWPSASVNSAVATRMGKAQVAVCL